MPSDDIRCPKTRTLSLAAGVVLLLACRPLGAEDILVAPCVVTVSRQADVPALQSGTIEAISASEGDVVQRGQLIVRLDNRAAELAREEAQLRVHLAKDAASNDVHVQAIRARQQAAEAEVASARQANSLVAGSVSETEVRRLELIARQHGLEAVQAEAEIKRARHEAAIHEIQLRLEELKLAQHVIHAPWDGVLIDLLKQPGEWVEPGQPVFRIISLETVNVEGFLSGNEHAHADLVGRDVVIEFAPAGGEPMTRAGRIVFASPQEDPVTHQFRVRAKVDNEDRLLRPGQEVRMRIAGNN